MSTASWRRDVDALAQQFGCSLNTRGCGHLRLLHPSGWFVFASATPRDGRALANLKSDLRRKAAGVWR